MKTLPKTYTKNGYTHKLRWRDESYAVTEVCDSETDKTYCFEAFRIKVRKPSEIKGKWYDGSEQSPCNEDWGTYGFTLPTYEKALEKIIIMKNSNNGKKN